MSQMFCGTIAAAAISVVFAVLDIRYRSVPLCFFAVVCAAGIVFSVLTKRPFSDVLLAALPGVIVMVFSVITEGGIGTGDGLYFLAMSGFLRPLDAGLLLLFALFLAAAVSMILFLVKKKRKTALPFLAFMPAVLLILSGRAGL